MKLLITSLLALGFFINTEASDISVKSNGNSIYAGRLDKYYSCRNENAEQKKNSSSLMNRRNYKAFDNARQSQTVQKDYNKDQGLVVPER